MDLNEDVKYIKGVRPNRAKLLNKIGIFTLKDLITYYPRGYEDRSKPKNICECVNGEVARLELSIKDGISKYGEDKEIIVFMHYPPVTKTYMDTEYMELMKKYNVKRCFYGHLHANSIQDAVEGNVQGIELKLVSSDGLDFKLLKI